jgi:arylsulfotransferase ASST
MLGSDLKKTIREATGGRSRSSADLEEHMKRNGLDTLLVAIIAWVSALARPPRRLRGRLSSRGTWWSRGTRRSVAFRRALRLATGLASSAAVAALCSCGGAGPSTPVALGDQAAVAAAAANAVTVSPLPGTPDASPATQISFLGSAGTQVSSVRVVGSRSGVHGGRLEAYSTGTGESFLPAKPFLPGERVTVHAIAGSAGAGRALSTTFTVAHQVDVSEQEFPINPGDPRAVQHYGSAPTLTPSTVTITTPAKPGAAAGDLFMAPYQGEGSPGPMIAEQDGALVWFHPLPAGEAATNFQVQQYEGKPVLTWWQGRIIKVGFGQGEDEIYNSSYERIATVRAGNGYHADLHEILLSPQGTAWIDAFDPIAMNLSSVHGSARGVISDSIIEEIDIKTGLVMWEWHALGHIPLKDSLNAVPPGAYPWDYVHINSISPSGPSSTEPGEVLLSARNTWTLYDVNMHTGGFDWLFGDGKHSSFKLGPGVRFYWQHDAELQPGGLISVFDNGSDPPKQRESSGLLLRPDLAGRTVTLVKRFANPTKTLLASSQGNTLSLPGGDWLLGYGGLPNFTEFDPSGHVLLDGTLGKNVQDFRTYLAPWSAQPSTPPAIAVQPGAGGSVTVQASWNGATGVASWQVLAGPAGSLTPLLTVPRHGFQTAIPVSTSGPDVEVRALDPAGQTLGTSPAEPIP